MAMAALRYAHPGGSASGMAVPSLPLSAVRKWLHGSWALLFSHADDFASYGFEGDRWLMMVRNACASAAVRPLALASGCGHSANWVTEAGGRVATLPIDDTRRYPMLRDAHQQLLYDAVNAADSRFALILDDSLRLRRTFAYRTHDQLPSPIDLVAMAEKLRSDGVSSRGF
jgi:hypothetical protein